MEEGTNQAISIIQLVSSSIPVLIGGLLAIGGTLMGTYLNSFINSQAKRKYLKREKLNSHYWLFQKLNTGLICIKIRFN